MIEQTVEELTPLVGTRPACRALGAAVATIYRRRRPPALRLVRPRATPARALSDAEREAVLAVLHADRFVDASPAQVWATLLDEGHYLASERTMYRLLAARHGGVRERRDQLTHPPYARPELLAERPNEVWSWDISKLKGAAKWTCFYLYAILDVYSRYTVGWTVQYRENAQLAKALIAQAVEQQKITRDQLTVHADRGTAMRSKPVAFLLADLGVLRTHSRPYTSTDNPYSEAQFKTLKYRPAFPDRFASIEHARAFCRTFFHWYNHKHRHSGIGLMTPAAVHYHQAEALRAERGCQGSRDFPRCDHGNSPPWGGAGRGWLRPRRVWSRRSWWRRMRYEGPSIAQTLAWCKSRSRMAVATVVSGKISPHEAMPRLVVRMMEPCS
jgi:putative transposase